MQRSGTVLRKSKASGCVRQIILPSRRTFNPKGPMNRTSPELNPKQVHLVRLPLKLMGQFTWVGNPRSAYIQLMSCYQPRITVTW